MGTARADGASADRAGDSNPGAGKAAAKGWMECCEDCAAARPLNADCAIAKTGEAADIDRHNGIPHAPGCLQWQHAHGQVFNGMTGCTCTTAAQKTARIAKTRRFMGLAL